MTGERYLHMLKLFTNELTTSELKNPIYVTVVSFRKAKHKIYTGPFYSGMGQNVLLQGFGKLDDLGYF